MYTTSSNTEWFFVAIMFVQLIVGFENAKMQLFANRMENV